MDLLKLNVSAASDTAKRFEIIDPFDGTILKDEKGVVMAVHMQGGQSTVARNADAAMYRDMPHADKKSAELTDDEKREREAYTLKCIARKLADMITRLEGSWQAGKKAVKPSDKELLAELIESQDWLSNQLLMRANDLRAYRPKM